MRQFINIINEAEMLNEAKAKFRLPDGLDPSYYQMTSSLADVENWKATVFVNNNGTDSKLGDMSGVGYVLISLKDNTIIPVSHDDEHNMGRDLVSDLSMGEYLGKRKMPRVAVDARDYIPICANNCGNYVYSESDLKPMLIAVKKFLSYGGIDCVLQGSSMLSGKAVMFSDFVAQKGSIDLAPGKLGPQGQLLYNEFVKMAQMLSTAGMNLDRIAAHPLFAEAAKLLKYVGMQSFRSAIPVGLTKPLGERLKAAQKANDIQALHEIIFGFDGLKNGIHNALRAISKESGGMWDRDYKQYWGDIPLAIDMLGRL